MHRFDLNKHLLLFLLLLLVTPLWVQAQAVLKGKVVDTKGEAISHATIWLPELKGEVADEQGNFTLAKLPKEGKLKISAVGFETLWVNWPAGKTTETFKLHESESELETFVVTGNFDPQTAKNSVYQVRSIDQTVIQNRAPQNIEQVLNTELGIRFSQDNATGSSNMELLGMSGQNIKILIDGVPMVGRQGTSNEININQIDINQIEKIEIVEGPMSVVYGADALAGVINIITKTSASQKLAVQAKIQEETVGSEYSPFAGKGTHIRSVSGTYGLKNWNFGAGFSQNNFGGWQGNEVGREKAWLPKDQNFANVKAGYMGESLSLNYQADFLNETIYADGPEAPLEMIDQKFITNRWMHRLNGHWDTSNNFSLNLQGAFTDYKRDTETWVTNSRTGEKYLSKAPGSQSRIKYRGFSWRMIGMWKLNSKLNFQPGIDLNLEEGSGERITENEGIQDYAVFLSAEWKPTQGIQIKPGLRKTFNSAYEAPDLTPSLNTKFTLSPNLDLRLAYAQGFRAPSIRELYFNFFDASHSITGNPDLKAETSHSFNGSLDWKKQISIDWKVGAVLGAFYNNVDNRIAYGQDPDDIQVTTLFNIENYRTAGFTLNHNQSYKNWDGNLGLSYIGRYNQLSEESEEVQEMSWTPEINANLSYSLQPWNTTFTLFYKLTGSLPGYETVTDADGNPSAKEVQLDGYQWMDFSVRKQFKHGISVNAGARNLFNVKQINSSSGGGDAHGTGSSRPIGYGRSYFLGIQYQFNQ
ncbi:TonB-dependent receptor [Algoriphagus chordae]|uniref:Outer membrane receptor for ferrienterochelin and colicins n=1 Tax=Algoriphagus chordae TaxID=237019 RepID=A0A2W7RUA8_9BACT|nr:TonB-dependent receptor [Algoriphagus chordae]PZX58209.1 outer membrane receptor for ferrienterochelin and colicins [Algoriphagus chordae]